MPYAFVEDIAASWERYSQLADALAGSPPPGLILHAAGPTDEGFRIIAVWQSEGDWIRFLADRLGRDGLEGLSYVPPVVRSLRPAHIVIGPKEEHA